MAKIIHNFGRTDDLDREELVRLCRSIARVCGLTVLDPPDEEQGRLVFGETGLPNGLKIKDTVSFSCVYAIEALWERLGLKRVFSDIVKRKRLKAPYERALLATTANRLCDAEFKLGVRDRWLSKLYLPACNGLKLEQMYEAMDLFYDHVSKVEENVFFQTANLFNLTVDLIFYDTTTASFSIDQEDDDENGHLRKFGRGKEGTWGPQGDRGPGRDPRRHSGSIVGISRQHH